SSPRYGVPDQVRRSGRDRHGRGSLGDFSNLQAYFGRFLVRPAFGKAYADQMTYFKSAGQPSD
ncbi:MAG TPA: hypothetical protein DF282_15105, partial [Hyphomonas sp.]|nr:hypothetical protein [Hyphomonas sp.]